MNKILKQKFEDLEMKIQAVVEAMVCSNESAKLRGSAINNIILIQEEMNKSIDKINERNERPTLACGNSPKDPNSERIDKILSYITVWDDLIFINGDDYAIRLSSDSDVLHMAIMTKEALSIKCCHAPSTRNDFTIREGTIGEAKLGDLFVYSDASLSCSDVKIIGFESEAIGFVNTILLFEENIRGEMIKEICKGLIFTRKQS